MRHKNTTSVFPFTILLQFSSLGNMKEQPRMNSALRHQNAGSGGHKSAQDDESSGGKPKFICVKKQSLVDHDLRQTKAFGAPGTICDSPSSKGRWRKWIDLATDQPRHKSYGEAMYACLLQHRGISTRQEDDESSLPTSFGKKRMSPANGRSKLHQTNNNYVIGKGTLYIAEKKPPEIEPFDICLSNGRNSIGCHIDIEYPIKETREILRPGMVVLKNYITPCEQVDIIKKCRELGLGPGGFFQPGYQDGAKLRLQMMCLGMNWDPVTKYEKRLRNDDSESPGIPPEFVSLVKRALQDSNALIQKHGGQKSNVDEILPGMSPDICIVNFYKTNGRLGLHQDRDESRESLGMGLPVMSLSVGDSAEFLYGDERDVDKAERVVLQSGDVLIFGGPARHIFHGVTSIIPNSAPPALREEGMLRPGRLNLTLRKY